MADNGNGVRALTNNRLFVALFMALLLAGGGLTADYYAHKAETTIQIQAIREDLTEIKESLREIRRALIEKKPVIARLNP